jgi:hypothetical protein
MHCLSLHTAALTALTLTPFALAPFTLATPARADQILGAGRIDSASRVVLPGGPILGLWSGGKYIATPDALRIKGMDSEGDISGMSVTPPGTNRTKTLGTWAAGTVTLDGTVTDADVQAAINSVASGAAIQIRFPATARVTLNANVDPNYRVVSWDIDPQATFSGTGTLPGPTSPSLYAPDHRKITAQRTKGSTQILSTDKEPVVFFDKHSNVAAGLNTTVAISHTKHNGSDGSAATSLTVDAYDVAGWPIQGGGGNPFIEAIRANSFLAPGTKLGSGYGIVAGAGAGDPATSYRFLFGAEMTVFNNSTDAPPTQQFAPTTSMAASFHATNDGTKKIDAFFASNPYIKNSGHGPARAGLLITDGSVSDTAFAAKGSIPIGIDFTQGTFTTAAMALPNGGAIRAKNAAGTDYLNLIFADGNNNVTVGEGGNTLVLNGPAYGAAGVTWNGNVGFGANATYDVASGANRVRRTYTTAVNLAGATLPRSSSDAVGVAGDVIVGNNGYLYWKESSGWKRVQGSSF